MQKEVADFEASITQEAKGQEVEIFYDNTLKDIDEMHDRKTKKKITKLKRDLIQITKDLESKKNQDMAFDLESMLPIEIIKVNPKFQHLQEDAIPTQERYMKILELKLS